MDVEKEEKRMHNTQKQNLFFIFKVIHLLLSSAVFYIFWLLFRYGAITPEKTIDYRYNYFIAGGYAVVLYLFIRTYNAYLLGFTRIRGLAFAQFISQFFTIAITYLSVTVAWWKINSPLWFIPMLLIQGVFDCIWSFITSTMYFKLNPPKRALLIYRNETDKRRFGSVAGKPVGRIYEVAEELQYEGYRFKEIKNKIEGFEAIFVAGINSRCRNGIAKYCEENDIPGFFLPHVGDVMMRGALHIQTFTSPVLYLSKKQPKPEYLIIKRLFDVLASSIGIIVFSPIMLITALAIKIYDRGPALYKQVRLTKDNKKFKILKFRSMRVDAEKDGVARLSTGDKDDRITPIGRIVRKCRLDELPQLFNILKGDMSIVGPRPERPEIAEQYYKTLPDFKLRLQVKAGLTGYAQVYGKYNTEPYEKLEFDLMYINDMSVATDLRLIFATFSILGKGESTEGVSGVTAMDYGEEQGDNTNQENDTEIAFQDYSVLMSVYHKEKAEHLREAMESIWDQTIPTDDFVLVCDGPLTDELNNVIEEMKQKHENYLNVVRLEKNCGLGEALNVGIKYCKNEKIARMDSDDISRPERCEKQLLAFQKKPEISICSGIVEEFSESITRIEARRVPPETQQEIIEFAKKRNPFNHPCVMYKKSAVEQSGGYKDFYLLEDYYLWIRMLQKGLKGYNIQEPLLWMRAGSEMYKRRAGWKYVKSQKALFEFMRNTSFISSGQYIQSIFVRTISTIIPNGVRTKMFKLLMRDR